MQSIGNHQFHPVKNGGSPDLQIRFDSRMIDAYSGETVIAALLRNQNALSVSEFDGSPRAGFCLMGACQDCSVWTTDGERLRACRTLVRNGLQLLSRPPMHGFQ